MKREKPVFGSDSTAASSWSSTAPGSPPELEDALGLTEPADQARADTGTGCNGRPPTAQQDCPAIW